MDVNELSVSSMFKLFDALILPVVSYCCPIWLHSTLFMKLAAAGKFENQPNESIKKIASDPIERLHIKFLKWTLGTHKKTSNAFCWGDTGRAPLVQRISKQAYDYFERLVHMDRTDNSCLARQAFVEQKKM